MNIRKPVANPFGNPPQKPSIPAREEPPVVTPEPSAAQPLPAFPTSGSMRPTTPNVVLPPLPSRPATNAPFAPLPDAAPALPEPTFEETILQQTEEEPLSEEEELHLRKIYLSVDETSVPQTLYALATDEDWHVRDAVASNPNTPESILLALSKDENDMVRQSVMENPSISDALLASFASDEDVDVLIEFIDFERTTAEMLIPLFQHEDDEVIEYLKNSDKLNAADKFKLRRI